MLENKKGKILYKKIAILSMILSFLIVIYGGTYIICHAYTKDTEKAVKIVHRGRFEEVEETKIEKKEPEKPIDSASEVQSEPIIEEVVDVEPVKELTRDVYETRMTSFWANDGYGTGECTGSGLCSWDFDTNEHGWYTYNGKLVIATATTYLTKYGWSLADGVHTYKYYDEITLNIYGIDYPAIVLDSCGSSMKTDRIDLFVSNGNSSVDTMIKVIM